MKAKNAERRLFKRFQIDGGFLFSDSESLVASSRVVDISRGGFRCMSLSHIYCPIDWLDGIELYDSNHDLALVQLRCKMVRCSQNMSGSNSHSIPHNYIFAFEFCSSCNSKIANLDFLL